MKNVAWGSFCIGLLAGIADAQSSGDGELLVYEGFGYPLGTSIEYRDGGFGWDGPWLWRSSFDQKGLFVENGAIIRRGSLRYGDLDTTGHHVRFSGENGTLELGRGFSEIIEGSAGTSTYISFIGQRTGPEADTSQPGYPWGDNPYPRGASLRFWDTSNGEQLSIGNVSNEDDNDWSIYGQSLNEGSGISFSAAPVFVVVRIDHNGDSSTPDDVYLWINPDLETEDTSRADLVIHGDTAPGDRSSALDYSNLSWISPFAGGADNNRLHAEWIFDELRIGTTYEVVTPTSPKWGGYVKQNEDLVDTGNYLSWLQLRRSPWLWSYALETWIYCPEDRTGVMGTWVHILDFNREDSLEGNGETWFGFPVQENQLVDTGAFLQWAYVGRKPWVWSYSLKTWIYIDETSQKSSKTAAAYIYDSNDLTLPLSRAVGPVPADGDEHVDDSSGTVELRWNSGTGVISHDVYFGEEREAVASAGRDDPEFQGTVNEEIFEVTELNSLKTYYWRVDELGGNEEVVEGDVWTFRTRHLAFPGAEGYGRFARGGRGGRVITVTNLNDSGPGSLRAAVEAEGPRVIVFDVGGLITLESHLVINDSHVTVAGQTAPGKGITIRKHKFGMSGAEDVIIRHIRVRPGDIAGITLDGMGLQGSNHCIIDHCSISWTLDEAFSSRSARNISLQNTLISEPLNVAGHKNYPSGTQHGYAASISGEIGSFHHNLLAHCAGRNWSLAGGLDDAGRHTGSLDIRNNVVYNWGHRTTDGGAEFVNFVGNYYKPGEASNKFVFLDPERNPGFGPQDYFVEGNILEGYVGVENQLDGVTEPEPYENFLVDEPFFPSYITEHSAKTAYKIVLSDVGVRQPVLDDHDKRVIEETLNGDYTYSGSNSGLPGLPDSQEDVGGWEDYPETHREDDWDSDGDGLPDWWESIHGTDPKSESGDFSDSNADPDGDGFTNLDDYLAWMGKPNRHCAPGESIEIDLPPLFRGFTDNPQFSVNEIHAGGTVTFINDGQTLEFTADNGFTGLGKVIIEVEDAEGATYAITVGIRIHP